MADMSRTLLKAALPSLLLLLLLLSPQSRAVEPAYVQTLEPGESHEAIIEKAANVIPTPRQVAYHKREFSGFIHYGPNSYTAKEWGNGREDPAVFAPESVDTGQWCDTMERAGMKTVVLTAKHHDGFVLFQSRYTEHGVMSSPYRDGAGDIVRELAEACRARGLKIGVYLSPADLYQMESATGLYGNLSGYSLRTIPKQQPERPFADPRTFQVEVDDYNEYFMSQLFELLTEYGPIHEVWFDGAHPKRKGDQKYVRDEWYRLIRELAPEAVIFGGPDARWVGNEAGDTRDTEWSVVPVQAGRINLDRPAKDLGSRGRLFNPGYSVYGEDLEATQLVYLIAEVDTSVRDGWFYRDDIYQDVRNADDVFDIYERSVGGNAVLLLNIPPNREGRFSPRDVDLLQEVGDRIRQTYDTDLLAGATGPEELLDGEEATFWSTAGAREFELRLPEPRLLNRFVLQEAIATHGQRIEKHALDAWVDGQWQEVATGTTVGYKKILRFAAITTDQLRVRVTESRLDATVSAVAAHYYAPRPTPVVIEKSAKGIVTLAAPEHSFSWNPGKKSFDNAAKLAQTRFYYTTDGSEPDQDSTPYTGPFKYGAGTIKARAYLGDTGGPVTTMRFGISKRQWKLLDVSAQEKGKWYLWWRGDWSAKLAFDGRADTHWLTSQQAPAEQVEHHLALDLGKAQSLEAFTYLPRQDQRTAWGMIEKGRLELSDDGRTWRRFESFEFGNILNDPVLRVHYFARPVSTRYLRIVSESGAQGSAAAGAAEFGFLPAD